jgi:hypothetical protein
MVDGNVLKGEKCVPSENKHGTIMEYMINGEIHTRELGWTWETQWEVRRPMALRRVQVVQVSPMSRASRECRVYCSSVTLHVHYCRLDLHCNICLCEATQDRVSTLERDMMDTSQLTTFSRTPPLQWIF